MTLWKESMINEIRTMNNIIQFIKIITSPAKPKTRRSPRKRVNA